MGGEGTGGIVADGDARRMTPGARGMDSRQGGAAGDERLCTLGDTTDSTADDSEVVLFGQSIGMS